MCAFEIYNKSQVPLDGVLNIVPNPDPTNCNLLQMEDSTGELDLRDGRYRDLRYKKIVKGHRLFNHYISVWFYVKVVKNNLEICVGFRIYEGADRIKGD